MLNMDIIKSILSSHSINESIFVEEKDFNSVIICSMKDSLPLNRWLNLENVLREYTQKDIAMLTLTQAKKYLGDNYIRKGVILK